MIRWFCRHRHTTRERRADVLHLVCDRCGYAVPAVTWTRAEKQKAQRLQRRLHAKAAPVVDIRKRRRA